MLTPTPITPLRAGGPAAPPSSRYNYSAADCARHGSSYAARRLKRTSDPFICIGCTLAEHYEADHDPRVCAICAHLVKQALAAETNSEMSNRLTADLDDQTARQFIAELEQELSSSVTPTAEAPPTSASKPPAGEQSAPVGGISARWVTCYRDHGAVQRGRRYEVAEGKHTGADWVCVYLDPDRASWSFAPAVCFEDAPLAELIAARDASRETKDCAPADAGTSPSENASGTARAQPTTVRSVCIVSHVRGLTRGEFYEVTPIPGTSLVDVLNDQGLKFEMPAEHFQPAERFPSISACEQLGIAIYFDDLVSLAWLAFHTESNTVVQRGGEGAEDCATKALEVLRSRADKLSVCPPGAIVPHPPEVDEARINGGHAELSSAEIWARLNDVTGRALNHFGLADRAWKFAEERSELMTELARLMRGSVRASPQAICAEIADVLITLMGVAKAFDRADILAAIERKLTVLESAMAAEPVNPNAGSDARWVGTIKKLEARNLKASDELRGGR